VPVVPVTLDSDFAGSSQAAQWLAAATAPLRAITATAGDGGDRDGRCPDMDTGPIRVVVHFARRRRDSVVKVTVTVTVTAGDTERISHGAAVLLSSLSLSSFQCRCNLNIMIS
jgi:hypothetical protein